MHALMESAIALSKEKVLWAVLANFIFFIYLIYLNRRYIIDFLKQIDRKTWCLVLVIFIFALLVRIFIPQHRYYMWTDEAVYMNTAKNILKSFSLGKFIEPVGWRLLRNSANNLGLYTLKL